MTTLAQPTINKYWNYALWLALFTIFYNLAEGLISVFFGFSDEALTLFGFGVDSFIEVMSGIGILAMVIRIRQNPETSRTQFEIDRVKNHRYIILFVGCWSRSDSHLQYLYRSQTNHNVAWTYHLSHLHCNDVGTGHGQTQSGKRSQLPADSF